MNNLEKLELKLQNKIKQKEKVASEIETLKQKIEEERAATILRAARAVNLTNEQCIKLEKGIKDKTVLSFLEQVYQRQSKAEEDAIK